MNRHELILAIEDLATRDPERSGYGYADSQHPWRFDPAIEQARQGFLDFLELLRRADLRGTYLQIGLGRHGGSHRALRLLAARVISIERDPARVAELAASEGLAEERDVLLAGDCADPEVLAKVRALAPDCDLLLLDGDDTYEQQWAAWEAYSPLVRPGGVVALVDRSQAYPEDRRPFDVDRLAQDLERHWLVPHGLRWTRLGGAHAIHTYVQSEAARARPRLPWPVGFVPTHRPRLDGTLLGFSIHEARDAWRAVHGDVPRLDPRAVLRNEHALVLRASSRTELARLVEAWCAVEPTLAQARELLRRERVAEARALVQRVQTDFEGLREALIPCLEATPHGKALLLALGTLSLLGERAPEGGALLRRALDQDMLDQGLLLTVANACLLVLDDRAAARALLEEAKQRVRRQKIAATCHDHLSGSALWRYPQLLERVHGVIHVGAHTGEALDAWRRLEIRHQAYVEPLPQSFQRLAERGREQGVDATLLDCALGEQAQERDLCYGARTEHASFLRTHPLAKLHEDDVQRHSVRVPVCTLDQLIAQGRLDPARFDLLVVDTEGTELEVLRGGRELLQHVEIVCVAIFLEAVYDGAPMPQQIQAFLRELDGGGFELRAYEPGPDKARGDAVFRRVRRRAR